MQIIGLTGFAAVGKDTVADYLVAHYGFIKYQLAGPLKEMLKVIGVDLENRETKEQINPLFGVTNRRLGQTLGTEWMRDCVNKDGWLLLAHQYAKIQKELNALEEVPLVKGIVFPDVRFPNEAEYVRKNGTLIHVLRPGTEPVEAHESEKGIPFRKGDRALLNDKTVEVTHRRLSDIMIDLQG